MDAVRLGLATVLVLALGGCAGTGEVDTETELPVACVSRSGGGTCATGSGHYYYDYRDNRCKPASGGGCGGRTLFESQERCRSYCGAAP
jgi:hypothetical protein